MPPATLLRLAVASTIALVLGACSAPPLRVEEIRLHSGAEGRRALLLDFANERGDGGLIRLLLPADLDVVTVSPVGRDDAMERWAVRGTRPAAGPEWLLEVPLVPQPTGTAAQGVRVRGLPGPHARGEGPGLATTLADVLLLEAPDAPGKTLTRELSEKAAEAWLRGEDDPG